MTLYTIMERRGESSDWALANPVLEPGQWAIELDTGKAKLGDGDTAYNDLPYYVHEDQVSAMIEAAIAKHYVLLEAGDSAADVPVGTAVGALIARKIPDPG